jgi:hypothetical protein
MGLTYLGPHLVQKIGSQMAAWLFSLRTGSALLQRNMFDFLFRY